jgi:hypothetical protein
MKVQILKKCINIFATLILLVAAEAAANAQSVKIVDRGLPVANLNGPVIDLRSNVSLGSPETYGYFGDDFTVPAPSGAGSWRIDTIRVWFVGGPADNDTDLTNDSYLGDLPLGNLSFWVGSNNVAISKVVQARFLPGSDASNNPNVVAKRVQYVTEDYGVLDYYNLPMRCNENGVCYQPPVGYSTIVQIDFKNLNLSYPAGTLVRFGMFADQGGAFTHASNAGLSGTTADYADGWVGTFKFRKTKAYFDFAWQGSSTGVFFDKPMDMNVQVFATLVKKGRSSDK